MGRYWQVPSNVYYGLVILGDEITDNIKIQFIVSLSRKEGTSGILRDIWVSLWSCLGPFVTLAVDPHQLSARILFSKSYILKQQFIKGMPGLTEFPYLKLKFPLFLGKGWCRNMSLETCSECNQTCLDLYRQISALALLFRLD